MYSSALGDSGTLLRLTNAETALVRTSDNSLVQIARKDAGDIGAVRNTLAELRDLNPVVRNYEEAAQVLRNEVEFGKFRPEMQDAIILARLRTSDPWIARRLEARAVGDYMHTGLKGMTREGSIVGSENYIYKGSGPDLIPKSGSGFKMEITAYTPSLNAVNTHLLRYPTETMPYILYRGPGLKR